MKLDEAADDFSLAIHYAPTMAEPWCNLGIVWLHKGDNDKAIEYLSRGIQLNPVIPIAYQFRSDAWRNKKEVDKAISDLDKAIRLDPNDPWSYYKRGLVWIDKGQPDKVIADLNETIRLNPNNVMAYIYRGGAWYAKKEYDRAIADCGQAIRLDPKFARAYNSRAWLWATCPDVKYRDGTKAVESATRACELTDRKEADYLDTLAAAYAEAGDIDAAVTWEENAQSLLANDDVRNRKDFEARLTLYKAKRAGDRSARAERP